MSGIYIPGVEMPENCDNCDFMTVEGEYGEPTCPFGLTIRCASEMHPHCPLVPVPEHGRLGDLEQAVIILERLRDHCGNEDMAFALNWAANTIRDLPTIIPADPVKEET